VDRNREAVLATARRVFAKKGYTGATLETIAEAAGFSKGVVYSQFSSKTDLFLALLERRIEERAAENRGIVTRYPGVEGLRRMLERAIDHAMVDTGWALLLVEFRALAARDPRTNRRYAELDARTLRSLASDLELLCSQAGILPAFSPEVLAQFILALDTGIALERAANPAALPAQALTTLVSRALGLA